MTSEALNTFIRQKADETDRQAGRQTNKQTVCGHDNKDQRWKWVSGSPFLDGSHGSCVNASDPLTHDDEITAQ